jgi:hypothetical protein
MTMPVVSIEPKKVREACRFPATINQQIVLISSVSALPASFL